MEHGQARPAIDEDAAGTGASPVRRAAPATSRPVTLSNAAPVSPADSMTHDRLAMVEEFGLFWTSQGNPRMEGRIMGYLILTSAPFVSSAELARGLNASAGSISTCARRLAEVGFVKRHAISGDRAHYWAVDDDVWGSFLAGERHYLHSERDLAERALAVVPDEDEAPRRRLENMRDYMAWLEGQHAEILRAWLAYKNRPH
jgi:DNA-binding transcriptional regulator GbsR (MarR family)